MSYRIGHRKNAELPLLRRQADSFKRGDILLGDKGFCSYYDVWKFKEPGVDSLIPLARRKPVEAASAVAKLGPNDLLIQWPKPAWNKVLSYSQDEWRALPEQLNLRQIKVNVTAPVLRAKTFYLVTTLTDATRYRDSHPLVYAALPSRNSEVTPTRHTHWVSTLHARLHDWRPACLRYSFGR